MLTVGRKRDAVGVIAILLFFLAAMPPRSSLAQAGEIDPQATSLLKAATTYVASQNQFRIDTQNTIEVVLSSGQKIQYDLSAALSIQRPDKLRAERTGDLVEQVFYYDGKTLTLYNPSDMYYAREAAPGTLEEMLDFARTTLDIIAPAGDFVYKNAYEILMEDVTSGFVVGKSMVAGARCDHLAFRTPYADWQIWIQEGSQPLPRKLVITTLDVAGAPQFTVVMPTCNLAPNFSADFFDFTPPKDAKQIDFQRLDRSGSPAR